MREKVADVVNEAFVDLERLVHARAEGEFIVESGGLEVEVQQNDLEPAIYGVLGEVG